MKLVIISLLILYGAAGVRGQITSLPAGSLESSKNVTISGSTLLLNATGGEEYAAYKNSITLSAGNASFNTFFTINSSASTGNGTLAFAIVDDLDAFKDLSTIKGLVVEFNTSCGGKYNDTYGSGWYHGGRHGRGFLGGYGGFGGLGGFGVQVLLNGTSIPPTLPSWGFGQGWSYTQFTDNATLELCTRNVSADGIVDYDVLIEYNATAQQLAVATFSCGTSGLAHVVNFTVAVPTGAVYVGFVAAGADYAISLWNFTANLNSSTIASLALSGGAFDSNPADGSPRGNSKSKTGLIVGVTVAAAVVAGALVLCACCICRRRRRNIVHMRGVPAGATAKAAAAPPPVFHGNAFVYDAQKPPKIVDSVAERDTQPLTRNPSYASTTTGTASWLPPVVPR